MDNEIDSTIYSSRAQELGMDPTWVHILHLPGPDTWYLMYYAAQSGGNNNPTVSARPADFPEYASIFDICYKLLADYKTKYLDAQA
jgi:hypothetical protein